MPIGKLSSVLLCFLKKHSPYTIRVILLLDMRLWSCDNEKGLRPPKLFIFFLCLHLVNAAFLAASPRRFPGSRTCLACRLDPGLLYDPIGRVSIKIPDAKYDSIVDDDLPKPRNNIEFIYA